MSSISSTISLSPWSGAWLSFDPPSGLRQLAREVCAGALEHVDVDVADRPEAAALDQHVLLVQHLGRLQHRAAGGEHGGAREPELDQLHAHEPVVDVLKGAAGELDHVDRDPLGGQVIKQRFDQRLRLRRVIEGAVEQVDPHDPQRLLLERVLVVEHPHVNDDLAVRFVRLGLEAHAHPAVALAVAPVAERRHRVGEGEEGLVGAAAPREALEVQGVLVIEHRLEPRPADVALRLAVDGVADRHVVGRHALGHGARGPADPEEPADHLLPGADLGEGAVAVRVQVDL